MDKPIYLDYNATTPVDKEVAEAMLPYLTEMFGNASSAHYYGYKAKAAIETAREEVAAMLECQPSEVIFTSGGTESNNMAIIGVANALAEKGRHIIISAIEHPAVTEVAAHLEREGYTVSKAPVDSNGIVLPDSIESLIQPGTILISVMHANNEVGSIQPVAEISAIAKKHGILVHTDAAQSVGKIKTSVKELGVDLLSIAGHKLYAPKGVGALYIKSGVKLHKLVHGANHEQDIRPGTENVPYIVALGKACSLITSNLEQFAGNMLNTRNIIANRLKREIPDIRINGDLNTCLPNTLNISFRNVAASEITGKLKDIAVSTGAACHSDGTASGTLGAMNLPVEYSHGAIRISTGRYTTPEEADIAAQSIINVAVGTGRDLSIENANEIPDLSIRDDNTPVGTGRDLSIVNAKEIPILFIEDSNDHPDLSINPITDFDQGMGCGCKLRPADLEFLLKDLPAISSPDVLVGTSTRDDAAVYRISDEEALVETVDFFTPMVDDPHAFGAIAAANALSDIYAMGAKPVFALNLVAFPVDKLPLTVLQEIMKGANEKLAEAGIPVLGGHSIMDSGIKFGMVVSGRVKTKNLITNAGCKAGDLLILTKPIGSGIISKACKLGIAGQDELLPAIAVMKQLNKRAAEIMERFEVNACTDITGFGLAGHLHEMAAASHINAEVWFDKVPLIDHAERFARLDAIPGSTKANEEYVSQWTDFTSLNRAQRALVCDSQTSGGLLISLPPTLAEKMLKELTNENIHAAIIGRVVEKGNGQLIFTFSK